ncbi:MAG: MraY family glycosyltransferase [Bacteroidota bacterium]
MIGAVVVIAATGFYDDVRELRFQRKFVVQIAVAVVLVAAGYRFEVAWSPTIAGTPLDLTLLAWPLSILWFVGMMNALNLIDGVDGLAASLSVVAAVGLMMVVGGGEATVITVTLVGALGAFLSFNRHPATIFMGDSGSLLLGLLLAALAVSGPVESQYPVQALLAPVMVLGIPITDTLLAILRRVHAGRSPFEPDRDHLHHRILQDIHPSHWAPVGYLSAVGVCFALLGVALVHAPLTMTMILILAFAGVISLVVWWLGYFKEFHRSSLPGASDAMCEGDGSVGVEPPVPAGSTAESPQKEDLVSHRTQVLSTK